jgi:hypothetical protein
MTREEIESQIASLLRAQPGLSKKESRDCIIVEGTFIFSNSYDDIPIYDEYLVKIEIPWSFPESMPLVFDTGMQIPPEFEHINPDQSLCLGASCELWDELELYCDASHFIQTFLPSFLYAVSFFKKYGVKPAYGERKHGTLGLIESFKERYNTNDPRMLCLFLLMVCHEREYRGHSPCPCGSGKKFRDCHGQPIIHDIRSCYHNHYQENAIEILTYFNRHREKLNGKRDSAARSL